MISANIYSVTVTVVEQKELRQRKIINLIIGDIFPGTEINWIDRSAWSISAVIIIWRSNNFFVNFMNELEIFLEWNLEICWKPKCATNDGWGRHLIRSPSDSSLRDLFRVLQHWGKDWWLGWEPKGEWFVGEGDIKVRDNLSGKTHEWGPCDNYYRVVDSCTCTNAEGDLKKWTTKCNSYLFIILCGLLALSTPLRSISNISYGPLVQESALQSYVLLVL